MSVDKEMYEAAELDGANQFRAVLTYYITEYPYDRNFKYYPFHFRILKCIRTAIRYHQRCEKREQVLTSLS